ncbi:MAG: hypothetical protein JO000_21210 [Alphaproteobacteria bacterium]|nr:hypothetical protein [Alphaproteobacteria bacterium]
MAEFIRDGDEPADIAQNEQAISVVTPRGGMRLEARESLRAIAFETVTSQSWSQRVALCLPKEQATMGQRAVLTELGPDTRSLRAQDRDAVLFDIGLGATQVDCYIRTADPQLVEGLRAHARRPVLAPGNPVMELILRHSPHRVFATRAGRIEVYQPIPPEDVVAPAGPNTQVMPELLAKRRTHPASEPIPRHWIACGYLYPTHPLHDVYGHARPFDGPRYVAFQRMLSRYGEVEYVRLKRNVTKGVIGGLAPASIALPDDRFAQASISVALRQLKASEGTSPNLTAWFAAYDRGPDADDVALGD